MIGMASRRPWLGLPLALLAMSGCSKGTETTLLTLGPADPSDGDTTSGITQDPIDPTVTVESTTGDMGTTGEPLPTTTDKGDSTGTEGEPTTGPGDGSSSTGPAGPVCGDAMIEGTEECDGAELGGLACPDVDPMFTGGTLACDGACAFDTSGCSVAPNPIVECVVVNAAIPDNSVVGVSSTINIPADQIGGTITDVDVEVELDHTYIGDLEIDVTHGGSNVIVFSRCLNEDNLHVTFDDSGAAINCASSDLGATVLPFSPLSAFNGGTVMTDWTLFVEDQAGIDTGTLQQWCVSISWM